MNEITTAVKDPIGALGGAFMISREAKAYGQETGLTGWTPYMRGRCGVLGEVDADVVTAAVGFFPARTVREAWEAGRGLPADEAARRYATVCHAFGRRKLAGFADADRLAELLESVVAAADVVAAPLAAGWRAMPLPEDGPARVIQLAHVLRELRGGLHVVAVLATGLTPLQAILSGASLLVADGPDNARYFGWPEPFPEVTEEVVRQRMDAENLTDVLLGPVFGALGDAEAEELGTLLDKAREVVFPPP
ncbi:MAG: SCO6745 family protein [Actinomadura sp.]